MHTTRPLQQTMDIIRTLLSRVTSLFFTRKLDTDLEEELRTHIDLAIEENLRRGMSQRQARTAALRSFGGVTQIRETYREQRGIPMLEQMKRDLRFGLRQLRKSPGFAITAILTWPLASGQTPPSSLSSTPSSFVPCRFPIRIGWSPYSAERFLSQGLDTRPAAELSILLIHLRLRSECGIQHRRHRRSERVFGSRVTVNIFDTLGIHPALGSFFASENSLEGQDHVVVLSYGYWRERFATKPRRNRPDNSRRRRLPPHHRRHASRDPFPLCRHAVRHPCCIQRRRPHRPLERL